MKKRTRILSMLLVLLLTLACLPVSAFAFTNDQADGTLPLEQGGTALDGVHSETPDLEQSNEAAELGVGEKTIIELQSMQLDPADLPEVISVQKADEKGHVNRLREQETDLCTVIYQNRDGKKTTYLFSRPVKYVDANGAVRDKSTALTQPNRSGVAYAMEDNDVKVYFPNNAASGVNLTYGGYAIRMIPVTALQESPALLNDGAILYSSVYGKGTILRYQPTLNGVKEDIVLVQNIGINSFDFQLNVTGLTPVRGAAGWMLQNAKGETVARYEEIVITDSNGKTALGELEITQTGTAGEYALRVTAPESFLNAADTVYPVYIDPTTTVTDFNRHNVTDDYGDTIGYYYRTILDTSLYNTTDSYDAAYALYENEEYFHLLGNEIEGYGSGSIVYRFGDFYHQYGRFTEIADEQIMSAKLYLPVGAGTQMSITAAPMRYPTADPNYGFSGIGEYTGEECPTGVAYYNSTATLGAAAGLYEIDFTAIAKRWAEYNSGNTTQPYDNPTNGLVLYSTDATYRRVAYADSASVNGQMLYCVFDINPNVSYYVINDSAVKFLKHGGSSSFSVGTLATPTAANAGWRFEYVGNDRYYIKPWTGTYSNYALRIAASGLSLAPIPEDYPDPSFLWNIPNFTSGGFYIQNVDSYTYLYWNGSTLSLIGSVAGVEGTYWRILPTSEYVNFQEFTLNCDMFEAGSQNNVLQIGYTPSNALYGEKFTYTILDDSEGFSLTDNGKLNVSGDAISSTLRVTHTLTGKTQSFTLYTQPTMPNEPFTIRNVGSGGFLSSLEEANYCHNRGVAVSGSGSSIENTHLYERWECEPSSDWLEYTFDAFIMGGTLRINKNNNKVFVESGYCKDNESNLWHVYSLGNGLYRIAPTEKTASEYWGLAVNSSGELVLVSNCLNNPNAKWEIRELNAVLYGVGDEQHDFTLPLLDVAVGLDEKNYAVDSIIENATGADALTDLKDCNIFISNTHGDASGSVYSGIVVGKTGSNSATLYSTSLASCDSNDAYISSTDRFDYLELAVFIGCSTGHGDRSLVDIVVEQGATVAVGFTESVYIDASDYWLEVFWSSLMNGNTVNQAIADACDASEDEYEDQPYKIITIGMVKCEGDGNYVLFVREKGE